MAKEGRLRVLCAGAGFDQGGIIMTGRIARMKTTQAGGVIEGIDSYTK